jgi:uncharacterized protein DUF6387
MVPRQTNQEKAAVDELLKQFDIRLYDPCKDFSPKDWYDQLVKRDSIRACVHQTTADEVVDSLLSSPLEIDAGRQRISLHGPTYVRDARFFEVWQLLEELRAELEIVDEYMAAGPDAYVMDPDAALVGGSYLHDMRTMLGLKGLPSIEKLKRYVIVDLAATNEQLEKEFKRWLLAHRKQAAGASLLDKSLEKKIKSWVYHRGLAYIDIQLVCEISGVTPTASQIGKALDKTLDQIRSDVAPLARKIQSYDTLNALDAAIKHENTWQ